MRKEIELEVMGKRKYFHVLLYEKEIEALKKNAEFLGLDMSEYLGLALSKQNAEVNETKADLKEAMVDLLSRGGVS